MQTHCKEVMLPPTTVEGTNASYSHPQVWHFQLLWLNDHITKLQHCCAGRIPKPSVIIQHHSMQTMVIHSTQLVIMGQDYARHRGWACVGFQRQRVAISKLVVLGRNPPGVANKVRSCYTRNHAVICGWLCFLNVEPRNPGLPARLMCPDAPPQSSSALNAGAPSRCLQSHTDELSAGQVILSGCMRKPPSPDLVSAKVCTGLSRPTSSADVQPAWRVLFSPH